MPYLNRSSWNKSQSNCPFLKCVYSHLVQGTRPSKKETNIALFSGLRVKLSTGEEGKVEGGSRSQGSAR